MKIPVHESHFKDRMLARCVRKLERLLSEGQKSEASLPGFSDAIKEAEED
ncbi:MAG: hypothetical protein JW994_01350 [Candidatus Omnitrophica bacterium]|nr:hypothetical protein [Candidatus Omnitrophota bacterium]